jgi:sigma-54 specific flagellar transcriptional regulator A
MLAQALLQYADVLPTAIPHSGFSGGILPAVAFHNRSGQCEGTGLEHDGSDGFMGIIGQSTAIKKVFALMGKVADTDSTVLINGETGSGKGLVARAIHDLSPRNSKSFVSVNCGAIPENLLESELFGHVKGAFTGATATKQGKFERANGGTIFLDEIGDMSPDLQVKILKVLEEREVEPVGGCHPKTIDVRVIAATHRDLEAEVEKGTFREDLYYRLFVIPVALPPLRCRQDDIPLLADHFIKIFCRKNNREVDNISAPAMKLMMNHTWPGNVRELKNTIERLVVLNENGVIRPGELPARILKVSPMPGSRSMELGEDGICLNTAVSEYEKHLIIQSLEKTNGVKNKAAKLLQLNRTTLVEKIKRYKIQQSA